MNNQYTKKLPEVVLAIVAFTILIPRGSQTPGLNADDLIPLFAAGVGLLIVLQTRRFPKLIAVPLLLVWCVAGLASTIQTASSVDTFITGIAKGSLRAINSIFLFVLVYKLTYKRSDRIDHLIKWIFFASTLLGVLAVLSYSAGTILGRPVFGLDPIARSSAVTQTSVPGRFAGTVDAANFAASFFLMTIPVTMALSISTKSTRWRTLYGISLALQIFGLIITFTRSSFAILALVLLGMLILLRRWQLMRLYVIGGIITTAIILIFVPQFLLRFTADQTGRIQLWQAGITMMTDYPWFGVGFGNFLETAQQNPLRYPANFNPHNSFIMLGAEGGVFVMLSSIVLAITSSIHMYTAYLNTRDPQKKILVSGILAGVAGFWLQNFFNDLLLLPKIITYFWLFYAIILNSSSFNTLKKSAPSPIPILQPASGD